MEIIRAATLTVSDLERSKSLYSEWLGYSVVEEGRISDGLAKSWGTPKTAGQPYAILQPESGVDVFLRFIEQPPVTAYKALRSFGWAAIEICTKDTPKVAAKMEESPFKIIGPPAEIAGLPAIFPMQIKGPDDEIVYLTQIRDNLPEYDLPRANSLIDKLFILVMACSDIKRSNEWLRKHMLISAGREMDINYTMINKAFGLTDGTQTTIGTLMHERDCFLEVDQYPDGTIERPTHDGMLPPCAAIGTFIQPDFDALWDVNKGLWITKPEIRSGAIYKNKRVGTLRAPDGTLIEMVDA